MTLSVDNEGRLGQLGQGRRLVGNLIREGVDRKDLIPRVVSLIPAYATSATQARKMVGDVAKHLGGLQPDEQRIIQPVVTEVKQSLTPQEPEAYIPEMSW